MAQLDMRPEEVQFNSKQLNEEVKGMAELLRQLEVSVNELDAVWVSNEKEAYKTLVYSDIADLKKILISMNSFATTAMDIANRRIERENSAANVINSL